MSVTKTAREAADSTRRTNRAEPFILTAMVSLVVGSFWLFRERELMLGHFYRPEFLSITHTLTLGWISMLMMGVLVRLGPRSMGLSIRSPGLLLVQFVLMFIGYTGMVFHFWVSGWAAMASAGLLLVTAAALQIYNFREVFALLRNEDWLPRYVAASMTHFLLAAILGVLLGFNKVYDILEGEFFPNIYAHAHLAALGWITMMIIGFEHRLLPMSKPSGASLLHAPAVRFVLFEVGLIGLVLSLLTKSSIEPLFVLLIVLSVGLHAWRPIAMLFRGKIMDRASMWATIALFFLLADSMIGFALSLGFPSSQTETRMHVQLAYGYVGFYGWITLTIAAQVYKLFPMFVWAERFKQSWGKEPVPAMRDLYNPTLQTLSGSFISIGVVGVAGGILANFLPLITFFHGMVLIGIVAFLINFVLMARWALLGRAYKPSPEDWESFRTNFPAADGRSNPS